MTFIGRQIFWNWAREEGVISPIESLFNTRQRRKKRAHIHARSVTLTGSAEPANSEGLGAVTSDAHKT
jgi:hypothetical protein